MKKIFLIAIIYIACFANVFATNFPFPPISCLELIPSGYDSTAHMRIENPHFLFWDTCNPKQNRFYKDLIHGLYGYGSYKVSFKYNIFKLKFTPTKDTLAEYFINDIDTNYNWMKDSLISLSNSMGTFTIKSKINMLDSINYFEEEYVMSFNRFQNIQFTEDSIKQFSYVRNCFSTKQILMLTSVEDRKNIIDEITINPNPVTNEINIILNSQEVPKNIEILSGIGESIRIEKFNNKINISILPKGVYFIKINQQFLKFIKE
ncbi:MAG: T9SS type A sorting domain-containing protein [Candidatus Kapabacteria bacterium]|nr:T9SS type A sorting domain-containing protein [Candidatus Kapabacteria bacterium]